MNIDSSTQVYLGGNEIVKIMKGLDTIWEKGSVPQVDYFYIENTYNGSSTLTITKVVSGTPSSSDYSDSFEYSKDRVDWTYTDMSVGNVLNIQMNQGDKVYFRNNNGKFNFHDGTSRHRFTFSSDQTHSAGGNLMSLLDYTNIDTVSLSDGCFFEMFLNDTNLTDTSNLVLPATEMKQFACANMFRGSGVTTAINLPATRLAISCYHNMYKDCTSLTTAQTELPATMVANSCYRGMFYGCTSLTLPPAIKLLYAGQHNCREMFYGCTSLTTAPELLPTTVGPYCYYRMFYNCTSLTTAPELPATSLVNSCYYQMFFRCSSLNQVTVYADTITAGDSHYQWLDGVAATGTFNNFGTATWPANSISGIPTGWTEYKPDYLYLENTYAGTNTVSIGTSSSGTPSSSYYSTSVEYSKDKVNWNTLTLVAGNLDNPYTITLNAGEKLYFRNDNGKFNYEDNGNWLTRITASESNVVGGNIMTLLNYKNVNGTNLIPGCFAYLFRNNNTMTSASNITLPSSIIDRCYMYTFSNCTALTAPPLLPATTAPDTCYSYMFDGDSSLTTAPVLLATSVGKYSYRRMFRNCSSLNEVTTYANSVGSYGTEDWLSGVATTGTFNKLGTYNWSSGKSGIPSGWTVVTS